MDVLNPCGAETRRFKPLAPRPGDLAGRSVGILDNSKPNAGVLLAGVAELLAARAGAGSVRTWRKPTSAQRAPPPGAGAVRRRRPSRPLPIRIGSTRGFSNADWGMGSPSFRRLRNA